MVHKTESETPHALVVRLTKECHEKGFFKGPTGSIAIKQGDNLFVSASANQIRASDLTEDHIFEVSCEDGSVVHEPAPELGFVVCESSPVFLEISKINPGLGAVMECRTVNAAVASHLIKGKKLIIRDPESALGPTDRRKMVTIPIVQSHFSPKILGEEISGLIKDLWKMKKPAAKKVAEPVVVTEESKTEEELEIKIDETILLDPVVEEVEQEMEIDFDSCPAVIVKGKGFFVWGKSWIECLNRAEQIDNMLEVAIGLKNVGLNIYSQIMTSLRNGEAKTLKTNEKAIATDEPETKPPTTETTGQTAPKRPRIEPPPKDENDKVTNDDEEETTDPKTESLSAIIQTNKRKWIKKKKVSNQQNDFAAEKNAKVSPSPQRLPAQLKQLVIPKGGLTTNKRGGAMNRGVATRGLNTRGRGNRGFTGRGFNRGRGGPPQRGLVPSPWANPQPFY